MSHFGIQTAAGPWGRVVLLVGVLLGSVAGCATTGASAPAANPLAISRLPGGMLILPGQGVGPIRFGESIDDAVRLLGPGAVVTWNTSPGYPNNHFYKGRSWGQYGLAAYYNPADAYGRVEFVEISAAAWHTPNGLYFGMPFNEALRLINPQYPPQCSDQSGVGHYCLALDASGIVIQSQSRTGPLQFLRITAPGFSL